MKQTTNHVLRLAVLAALAGTSVGAYAAFPASPIANEMPMSMTISGVPTVWTSITSFSPSGANPLQVTVSLSGNTKFATKPTLTCSTATTSGGAGVSGIGTLSLGGAGSTQAVFSISTAPTQQLKSCRVSTTDLTVTGTHASVNESITFKYGSLASSSVNGNLITWQSGVSAAAVNKATVSALVVSGFNKFTGGVAVVTGGLVKANGKPGVSASTATIPVAGNIGTYMNTGSITFAGTPLASTKATAGVFIVSATKACSTANRIGSAKGGAASVTFTMSSAQVSAGVKGCFAFSGTAAIPAGTITAKLGGTPGTNMSLPTFTTVDVLQINRDGSSISLMNMPRSTDTDAGFLRVYNTSSIAGAITATIYDQNGTALASNCSLSSSLAAGAALVMSAAQIETACGFTVPTTGRYRLELAGAIPTMKAQMFARSNGVLTNVTADK